MHYRDRLKEWISDHDLKQKALAKDMDISESVMSHYLTGRTQVPIEMLVKLSKHFGVGVDYLAGTTDDPTLQLQLSKSERHMIECFRTLSQQQKELILQNVQFMQEQNQRA